MNISGAADQLTEINSVFLVKFRAIFRFEQKIRKNNKKKTMTYILDKNEEDELIVLKDGQQVSPTDVLKVYPEKRVYALRGQMGAGKTTFTKALCEAMGTEDVVNSPTFAIVNVYEDRDGEEIYHFDCYRLKSVAEALDFGAEEYLYSGQYCFIEWPEMIEPILPEDTVDITIRLLEDGRREMTINL